MHTLSTPTLLAFAVVPGTLTRLTLLADTQPYSFFERLSCSTCASHAPRAAPLRRRALRRASPCSTAAPVAPGRVMLRIANTLYHDLRPAVLFGALGCALKELVLVLAHNVDVRTHGRLLGALANTGSRARAAQGESRGYFR